MSGDIDTDQAPTVRIARGELADDALAALTSVLLVLARSVQDVPLPVIGWRRLNWHNGYRSPVSWHEPPRHR